MAIKKLQKSDPNSNMKSKTLRNLALDAQRYHLEGQKVPFGCQNGPREDTLGTQNHQNEALGMPFGRQWARIRTLRGHLGTIMAAKIHISVALGSTLGAHQAHCT